jgi:hypothetical protein
MHPLLAERKLDQVQLLETILEGRARLGPPNYTLGVEPADGRRLWPNFQYVERMLYRKHKVDAHEVLSTCPMMRGAGGDYGWVWADYPLRDESFIGVTIAGMSHMAGAVELVGLFLHMLTLMVAAERAFEPSPAEVLNVSLSTDLARTFLKQRDSRLDIGPRALDDLRELLRHEPATWHSSASEDDWKLSPSFAVTAKLRRRRSTSNVLSMSTNDRRPTPSRSTPRRWRSPRRSTISTSFGALTRARHSCVSAEWRPPRSLPLTV